MRRAPECTCGVPPRCYYHNHGDHVRPAPSSLGFIQGIGVGWAMGALTVLGMLAWVSL